MAGSVPHDMATPLEVLTPPPASWGPGIVFDPSRPPGPPQPPSETTEPAPTPISPIESARIDERLALLAELKETIRRRHYSRAAPGRERCRRARRQ